VITRAADQVASCNRCGLCQEVCPTYKVTGLEQAVARGRNRLVEMIASGGLSLHEEDDLRRRLDTCLLCGACTEMCPSGAATDESILRARADLFRRRGTSPPYRVLLRRILVSPRRLSRSLKLLWLYQVSGLRWATREVGLLRLLGVLGEIEGLAPSVPALSLRARRTRSGTAVRGNPEARGGFRGRVAYFLGCLTDNLYPHVGEALISVLEYNGYDVTVVDNACCGVAQISHGDVEMARELARRNLDAIREARAEVVVTDCATCAATLSRYPDLLTEDPGYHDLAAETAARVKDISRFLVEEGDPCHLARGMGVRVEPRQLLVSIPGLVFTELAEADSCCGGAGSYGLSHHELSVRILETKTANIARTGASLVATSCPSCLVQIAYGLRRSGVEAEVVHPVELLWRSYLDVGEERGDETDA